MADLLETVEIETGAAPTASIVWLHGLGADGHDFAPIVPELRLRASVRFVFPHAPMRAVTINQGAVMRAWYDVRGLGADDAPVRDADAPVRREDPDGVRASEAQVEALLAREKARGIDAKRLVLAGFSQGGAMALHTGLRHAERLAGVMALSCSLPLADTLEREASPANRDVPIFFAHGLHDPLIPMARAKAAHERLTQLGFTVEWHEYAMPHSVCMEEVNDISAWLARVLAL